jgi:polyhydroxyalkanoate synthase subunit PhaC
MSRRARSRSSRATLDEPSGCAVYHRGLTTGPFETDVGLAALLDPLALGEALADTGKRLARNPGGVLAAGLRFGFGLADAASATAVRALGGDAEGPVPADARDPRFADPAWRENPLYFGLLQSYNVSARFLRDLVAAAGPDGKTAFVVEQTIDALAPTNFLATNPLALKRAFETGGSSVREGARHFVEDVAAGRGPRQVDRGAFTLGKDLAATPGKVVFRNRLIELIQYAPQTESVFEVPLLFVPPWINKYYVMDLAPGRSFAEWAVQHRHTLFCISYRNPDESLRDVSFDDYLLEGPLAALDTIAEISGAPQTNLVGFCLGGTLTAALLAHLAALGRESVRSATLLATLVDFEDAGMLASLVDARAVDRLEHRMERRGYLEGASMATLFNLLRSKDLVWRYVVSSWLLGEDPAPFDILAWNSDATRMPAKMHAQYLRSCYLRNELAKGTMELAGTTLDLDRVDLPIYVLSAREDHIAPWRSCFRTTRLFRGARFVLTSSGHIAGIVNPPGPKPSYWAGGTGADPEEWLASAEEHRGSWWEDWAAWIEAQGGGRREPPPLGPELGDAPGTYVFET